MTKPEEHDSPQPVGSGRRGRRLGSASQVFLILVVGLTLAALLGAGDLVKAGEAMAAGPWRIVVLGVAGPLRRTASLLYLDRPRMLVEALRNGSSSASTSTSAPSDVAAVSVTATTTIPPTTTSTTAGPTTSTLPVASGAAPVRVWVGGDSMVESVGDSLINTSDSVKALKVKMLTKINSGLCRPDYFDWPAAMREVMARYDPQASVVMFGGNDMQGLVENGRALAAWSPEWTKAYGRRVGQVIEILSGNGGRIFWVAAPTMRAEQDARWAFDLNQVYRDVCSRYPQATYVDAWRLFSDEDGNYAAYLKDDSGRSRLVREPDGIHFTLAGGDRVSKEIMKELRARWVLGEL